MNMILLGQSSLIQRNLPAVFHIVFLSLNLQRDSPDDPMKAAAGMVTDRRMDISSMGDFNGGVGKNPGSRHQFHKESAMDRSPYFDKVNTPCL